MLIPGKKPGWLKSALYALAVGAGTSEAADYFVNVSIGNDTWSGAYQDPQPAGCDAGRAQLLSTASRPAVPRHRSGADVAAGSRV